MKVTAFLGALAALATLPQVADAAVFRFEIGGTVEAIRDLASTPFSEGDPFQLVATIDDTTPEIPQSAVFSEYATQTSSFSIAGAELPEFTDQFLLGIVNGGALDTLSIATPDPVTRVSIIFSDQSSGNPGGTFTDTDLAQLLTLEEDLLLSSLNFITDARLSAEFGLTGSFGNCEGFLCEVVLNVTSATVQQVPLPAGGWLLLSGVATLSLLRSNRRARA